MCRREVVVGRPIQNPRRRCDSAVVRVQARMVMALLSPSGRLQMDRSRFPRFESTARVVAKAEAGATNEVMFWSASRIRLRKARQRLEPEQLIGVAIADGSCRRLPREIEEAGEATPWSN